MTVTWGKLLWPIWLTLVTLTFLVPEIYALITNANNTLSDWIWRLLNVSRNQQDWTAAHFLVFGVWLTLVVWLTFHFFFRRFT
jgi:hypothetical protein